MRERRGSLVAMAAAKVDREGAVSLLRQGPAWLRRAVVTETRLRVLRLRRRVRYRRAGLSAIPQPTATIEIDPRTVSHLVPFSRFDGVSPRALLGTVRGGEWDTDPWPLEARQKYRACRARVEDGASWEATGIIDRLAAELVVTDADTIEHGCRSRADLSERYGTEREALYRRLRNEGYDRSVSPVCCRVHVGRDGDLLFGSGGHHRFYLSRLLDVESVPVQVLCRHADWQAVREAVAAAGTTADLSAGVQRHLGHPDLRTVVSLQGAASTPTS